MALKCMRQLCNFMLFAWEFRRKKKQLSHTHSFAFDMIQHIFLFNFIDFLPLKAVNLVLTLNKHTKTLVSVIDLMLGPVNPVIKVTGSLPWLIQFIIMYPLDKSTDNLLLAELFIKNFKWRMKN